MFEFAAVTCGFAISIVLSVLTRNHRLARPHPPVLLYLGYMLCGLCAGTSLILATIALAMATG
ncbi:hypothetical protein GGR44_001341 [Sphingobium fontiphilum]|uniref:Uncharacterized protein n=1 Tax=Sphingobium fontiphilum TaxID=944425 RepID=A0A7W6GQ46_9SPHN|nr:hypothetical protein [Sphingobium fontiphilum]MBB3981694.1 hypothetical protein [Sphingobium fontiphilum]